MTAPARQGTECLLEELEPRVLFSADLPGAMPADAVSASVVAGRYTDLSEAGAAMLSRVDSMAQTQSREIAFVDAALPNLADLVRDLRALNSPQRSVEVILLRDDEDGLARISTVLERTAGIDAVHLLGHGAGAGMRLGGGLLDLDSLRSRAELVQGWGAALTESADIFLYGCDVAGSASGRQMTNALADLTGADVAASLDTTGSAEAGGDWDLEYRHGDTDASRVAGFASPMSWQGALSNEFQVNVTTANNQDTEGSARGVQHAVAMDASGNYVVVWTSKGQDGSQDGVYARLYASNGTALTGEIQVNQTTAKDQKWANVASDDAGNFVVTWTNRDDAGDQGDIYIRRFDASGAALTAEIQVNTTVTTTTQQNSTLAMDGASGDFVVVWEGEGSGDADGVFFRRYNADGTAKDATELNANGTDAGVEENASVALSASGSFVVVWERSSHLYFQRFNAAGVAQGGITQADSGLTSTGLPTVGMNASGDFTVMYRVSTPLFTGIWGHGFNADGTQKYAVFQAATGDATDASIAMASDGAFILTYEATADGDGRGIYARKYLANGTADGSAFRVNQHTTGQQENASVALVTTSNSVIVWSGAGSAGDSVGVYARQFISDNTAPVNSVPGAQTTREDETLTFSSGNGNLISISDADAGTGLMQVTLTTVNGLVTLGTTSSLTFSTGDGTADATMSFSATRAQINTALATLHFIPSGDFNGAASVQIDTDDLGNTGFGGPLTDSDTVSITVSAVNDGPTAVNDAYTVLQGQPLTVTAPGLLSNDTDAENDSLEVLTLTDTANGVLSVSGSGSLTYTPTGLFTGTDSFGYLVRDVNDGRTHYWGLGGHADDSIGVADGTVSGATTVSGQFGSALHFDGVNDYAALPDVTYSNGFTLSFWFKTPSNAGSDYSYLYSHGQVGQQNSVNVYLIETSAGVAGAGMLRTQVMDSNDAVDLIGLDVDAAALGLADNNWHLYTLTTGTGSGARVYIDGALQASSSRGGDGFNPTGSIYLGAREDRDGDRFYAGAMDGVQIHDHALVQGEIDDLYATTAATVTFTVTANTAPTITSYSGSASVSLSVAENGVSVGTITATDGEAPPQSLTYTLSGADAARFSIGSSSGVLVFSAAPDRENALDAGGDNVYDVTVTVSDGIASDSQDLSITVTDVNEAAVGAISDTDAAGNSLAENAPNTSTTGITAHATDSDATNNTVTYSLDNNAGGRFTIDAVSGAVTVAGTSLLDYESATSHLITVRATSADGSTSTASFTITLTPQNDNSPVFVSSAAPSSAEGSLTAVTLVTSDADAPSQSITYTVTGGTDQARFAISGSNLQFIVAPDYEIPLDANGDNVYEVQVTASDGAGGTTVQSLMVTVTDAVESSVAVTDPVLVIPPGEPEVSNPSPTQGGNGSSGSTQTGVAATPATESSSTRQFIPLQTVEEKAEDSAPAVLLVSAHQEVASGARRVQGTTAAASSGGSWSRPQSQPVIQNEGIVFAPGVSAAPAAAISTTALRSSLGATQWLGQLQFLRNRMEEGVRLDGVMVGTTAFVSGGLSVGYVIWLVRGGLLVSTLLSSLPAWHTIDPLPVLGRRDDDDETAMRSDAVEGLFDRARKALRTARVAGEQTMRLGPMP